MLEIDRSRVWRWQGRRTAGTFDDDTPGGNPILSLPGWEVEGVLALAEEWGETDQPPQAGHRGSHTGRA